MRVSSQYLNILTLRKKNPLDDKTTSNGAIAPFSLVMKRSDILLFIERLMMVVNGRNL
jgi:hypothetical protein